MNHLLIRPMDKSEISTISQWFMANEHRNNLDDSVLSYPATNIYCVYRPNGQPIGHLRMAVPVQPVFMLESLAPAPDITPMEAATAVRDIVKIVAYSAQVKGIKEIYFMGHDAQLNALAEAHGFRRLTGKLDEQGMPKCDCMPIFLMKL